MFEEDKELSTEVRKWSIFVLVAATAITTSSMYGCPAYNRYQLRQDSTNEISINALKIQQTQQLVDVEKQKAQIREQEAIGIAEAQRTINATLTDRYLQHEAIMAQEKMANSPNHTEIYIPSGTNGIPLVKTVDESPNQIKEKETK